MPFTGAHPSIFLPFLRNKRVSATALIAGSMAPDFEYFFKMSSGSEHSHTLAGILYFDLPVTLLISLLFHQVVKRPLSTQLPLFIRIRNIIKEDFDFTKWLRSNYFTFFWCALLGCASHLAWDSLTHNTWVTQSLPVYQMVSLRVGKLDYPLFYLLQQISTIIGTLAMFISILFIPATENFAADTRPPSKWFWPLVFSGTIVICSARFIHLFKWPLSGLDQLPELGDTVVTVISGFLISLILTSWYAGRSIKYQDSLQKQ